MHPHVFLDIIKRIHCHIRDQVLATCEASALEQLAAVTGHEGGDTIFAIDRVSEAVLLEQFAALGKHVPFRLVAEGLGESGIHDFPQGVSTDALQYVVIVDPIDGTRGLMYQKRAAWILTGVAPYRGATTDLRDITIAVMTEIPLVKQHISDTLWAIKGEGAHAERYDRVRNTSVPLPIRPSQATTIRQGFGNIARFFPGERALLAAVDDMVVARMLGESPQGRALAFEDQYISTGGQLYELLMGHDRWLADVRPLLIAPHLRNGAQPMLCCHPYDVCTELIAREAGVIVCKANGAPLDAPLDVHSPVSWVAVANAHIAKALIPVLQAALTEHGLVLEEEGV